MIVLEEEDWKSDAGWEDDLEYEDWEADDWEELDEDMSQLGRTSYAAVVQQAAR